MFKKSLGPNWELHRRFLLIFSFASKLFAGVLEALHGYMKQGALGKLCQNGKSVRTTVLMLAISYSH